MTAQYKPLTRAEERVLVERERARHHAALEALANSLDPNNKRTGLQLWRKLRRIEQEATRWTTALCNGEIDLTEDERDAAEGRLLVQVQDLFGKKPPGLFINGDPRGYALKLEPGSVPFDLETDWGRYQILAPEID